MKLSTGVDKSLLPVDVHIAGNTFVGNHLVQPWVEEAHFKGGILEIDAVETNTQVQISGNLFDDNYVRGGEAGLIYIKGPKIITKNNSYYRSGSLDTTRYKQTAHPILQDVAIFDQEPWKDYTWTQDRGIFWFEGVETEVTTRNTSMPIVNEFTNNTISYAFSWKGGVYSHMFEIGVQSSYCLFKNNSYSHIYSLDAAIMKMVVSGVSGTATSYVVHNHTEEFLDDVQNGAYRYLG